MTYANLLFLLILFRKMKKAIEIDPQDKSAYSSSSIKLPVTILNEYATKNNLIPQYNLIHDDSSLSRVSFKYSVNLDKLVAEGVGFSKKEAKHLAASNLLKKIIDDKPQLMDTDFNECAMSPYDNNIKLNAVFTKINKANEVDQQDMSAYSSSLNKHPVSILNEYATKNNLIPHYNLIHKVSSQSVISFKYTVNLDKFVAEGFGHSKKEAKQWAAKKLLKKLIDDKPQLMDTDFNECAMSPYDNNIKLNTFFTKINKANEVDQQDTSAHSSSSNKQPVTILNEYAIKNNLIPHYNLIHDGSSLSTVSFKYSVNLDKLIAEGVGSSKKEAKNLAASNLLKKIIDDKPQLLYTDFNEYTTSPYDKNIKVNFFGQLDDLCRHKNIELPEYNLVKGEEQGHNKLLTIDCHAAKTIETETHKTKQQAKYLADFQMVNSLMLDMVEENGQKNPITKHPTCEDYHLVFKNTEWKHSDTLVMIVNQYIKNGKLDLPEPHNILKKIISEHKNMHITSKIEKIKLDLNNYFYFCTFALTDVYPNVYGYGMDTSSEKAQHIAVNELLINFCILLK